MITLIAMQIKSIDYANYKFPLLFLVCFRMEPDVDGHCLWVIDVFAFSCEWMEIIEACPLKLCCCMAQWLMHFVCELSHA